MNAEYHFDFGKKKNVQKSIEVFCFKTRTQNCLDIPELFFSMMTSQYILLGF